jgi:hypothetical protein
VYLDQTDNATEHGNNGQTSAPARRRIFREEALQYYIENEEKIELPVIISPRYFVYLWIVSMFLMVVGLVITFWPLIQQWVERWT